MPEELLVRRKLTFNSHTATGTPGREGNGIPEVWGCIRPQWFEYKDDEKPQKFRLRDYSFIIHRDFNLSIQLKTTTSAKERVLNAYSFYRVPLLTSRSNG